MDLYNFGPYVIPTCTPSMVPLFIMYDNGLDNDRRGFGYSYVKVMME